VSSQNVTHAAAATAAASDDVQRTVRLNLLIFLFSISYFRADK
jgi:hypothetical protein